MIQTGRLTLRPWHDADRAPFAAMNQDPRVTEFLGGGLTAAQSDELVNRIQAHFAHNGFGLYAAEFKATGQFIGYIGVAIPGFEAHFTPCVEIGWRLAAACWGQGLATEGARAAVQHAFDNLSLAELVSFTVPANTRSRRVMEKLGMTHDPRDDFDHPRLPEGPLRRHVLYRIKKA